MTVYKGFQVCHSSVPGVILHQYIFQQLFQVIILLYAQSTTDFQMVMLVDILSTEYGEIV